MMDRWRRVWSWTKGVTGLDEAESGTLDRVLSSHVTMTRLLAGKLAFATLLAFSQLVLMFLWAWAVFKLDFLPIIKERYMLTCRTATLAQPAVKELVALLKGPEFARVMKPVPGYELDVPGEVVSLGEVLPWLARAPGRR